MASDRYGSGTRLLISDHLHFKYEPITKAMSFLEQVQRQVNEIGIAIECHISET